MASIVSLLPCRRRSCRSGRDTSTTSTPARRKNCDGGAPYEPVPSTPPAPPGPSRPQPGQQLAVPRRGGRERLDPQQPADAIQRRRHVHIQMRVHTTSNRARGIYDCQRHPFHSSLRFGWHRRQVRHGGSSCSRRAIRHTQTTAPPPRQPGQPTVTVNPGPVGGYSNKNSYEHPPGRLWCGAGRNGVAVRSDLCKRSGALLTAGPGRGAEHSNEEHWGS
jgi:hypothetical protein